MCLVFTVVWDVYEPRVTPTTCKLTDRIMDVIDGLIHS